MKLGKLTMFSAAALLAGGISIAAAAENGMGANSGTMAQPEGQCWDVASNTVKNKSGSPSGAKTPGGVTTGSAPSGQSTNTKGTGNSAATGNASNLPKC
jgi:hypothetical protein